MSQGKTLPPTSQSPGELASAIELAYGLLWLPPVDREEAGGWLASEARKVLLRQIGRDGQARGIEAARPMLEAELNRRRSPQKSPQPFNEAG